MGIYLTVRNDVYNQRPSTKRRITSIQAMLCSCITICVFLLQDTQQTMKLQLKFSLLCFYVSTLILLYQKLPAILTKIVTYLKSFRHIID